MTSRPVFLLALLLLPTAGAIRAQVADPPARVGRVSEIAGKVSLKPVGSTDWTPASVNYPLTSGDAAWAGDGSRAEVHLGAAAMQLAPSTSVTFDSLTDRGTRLTLKQGSAIVRVRALAVDERFEVYASGGRIVLQGDGSYRFDLTPDGKRTTVTVRSGKAELISGYEAYPVLPGEAKTFTGVAKSPVAVGAAIPLDTWEAWADSLNRDEDSAVAAKYVSRSVVGYDDLDSYGDWNTNTEYGAVWQPRAVSMGWTPYRYGRWESIRPWGWTWLPDEPWGFATSHYGRWAELSGRWSWIPGNSLNRPVYAPAVVAFLNDGTALVTNSYSPGNIGWLPLGPGDPYYPSYTASAGYLGAINASHLPWSGWSFTAWSPYQNALNNQYSYYNLNRSNSIVFVSTTVFLSGYRIGSTARPFNPQHLPRTIPTAVPTSQGTPVRPVFTNRPRIVAEGPAPVVTQPTTRALAPAAPPSAPVASNTRQPAPVTQPLVNPAYATGQRVAAPQLAANNGQYQAPDGSQQRLNPMPSSARRAAPDLTTRQSQQVQYAAPQTRQRAMPQAAPSYQPQNNAGSTPSRSMPMPTQPGVTTRPAPVMQPPPSGAAQSRARPVGGGL